VDTISVFFQRGLLSHVFPIPFHHPVAALTFFPRASNSAFPLHQLFLSFFSSFSVRVGVIPLSSWSDHFPSLYYLVFISAFSVFLTREANLCRLSFLLRFVDSPPFSPTPVSFSSSPNEPSHSFTYVRFSFLISSVSLENSFFLGSFFFFPSW